LQKGKICQACGDLDLNAYEADTNKEAIFNLVLQHTMISL